MQNLYGDHGVRYLRRLAILQTLFFFLVLCLSILGLAYLVGKSPESPWTFEILSCLLAAVLAGWVVELLHAIQFWNSSWRRRTQQLVVMVTVGVVASSLLFLTLPHTVYWEVFEFTPVVLTALAACAGSALFVHRLLSHHRISKVRHEAARQKLDELRTRGGAQSVARIELSHALETGNAAGNPLPGPQGYIVAGLTSKPWHDTSAFEWVSRLEQSHEAIRQELEEILADKSPLQSYHYLGQEQGWKAFRFVEGCRINEENCRRLPKTAAILKSMPHFPYFRDAMFSILKPGTILPPHRDFSNIYLTCHLGLTIPRGCGIRVGGQTRGWDEGKCIIFDSSYEHDAWNTSDVQRIVLLIDFLHPELTEIEAEWLAAREIASSM